MSASAHSWKGLPIGAKAFIGLVIAAGMASLLQAAIHQSSKNIAEFICYLGIAVLASVFSATGSYANPQAYTNGMTSAVWVGVAVLVRCSSALPRRLTTYWRTPRPSSKRKISTSSW